MLEPKIAEIVAARDKEMELRIMVVTEDCACFSQKPAAAVHHALTDVQGGCRLGYKIEESWRIISGVERNCPQVLTGDQRAVNQFGECESFEERLRPSIIRSVSERSRAAPCAWQSQTQLHSDVVARVTLRIDQAGDPVNDAQRVVAIAQVTERTMRGTVANRIK